MSEPIALLTREDGRLGARAPAFGPCDGCDDGALCGPYPCPRFDPADMIDRAMEAQRINPAFAGILGIMGGKA